MAYQMCQNHYYSCSIYGPQRVSKFSRKNVSHLINKENVNYITNAVVCINNEYKFYFFHIYGNLIEKRVFLAKPSIQEITDLLDHNVHTIDAFYYESKCFTRHEVIEKNAVTKYNINWDLVSSTGSTLITASVNIKSKIGKIKFYAILDNCVDPERNENFLKPCSISILKSINGDYKVNYYGLNKKLLLSNIFPFKITLKNDLQTILNDKRLNKEWCRENLENIKKRSKDLKKNDCIIL